MCRETAPLFSLRFYGVECDVSYLSHTGAFDEMPETLLSPATGCILNTHGRKFKFIDVSAANFTRFSFAIAIFQNGFWRLRFTAVLSRVHGLLLFKAHSTLTLKNGRFDVPDSMKKNTVAIIGLKPKRNSVSVSFDIFANAEGNPTDDKMGFNGYSGEITWAMDSDDNEITTICDRLDGYLTHPEVKFNGRLLNLKGKPISTFMQQRNKS